jgi:hypothetical protein
MESKQFAWWPTKMTSGKTVWLKQYILHRSLYDETTGRPPLNSLHFKWTETLQEKTWRLIRDSVTHNRNIWNTPELTKQDKQ